MSTARTAAKPTAKRAAAKQPAKAPRKAAKAPVLTVQDYLQKILTSRVYDVAVESSLDEARNLSRRWGHQVYPKREDQQPVFSFKLRGAYNKMAKLSKQQLAK